MQLTPSRLRVLAAKFVAGSVHCVAFLAVDRLANGHEPTSAYVRKRTGGSKADLDILRNIKRCIAREVYPLLTDAVTHRPDAVSQAA